MNDLEEDPEMRADVNLYKRKIVSSRAAEDAKMKEEDEEDDDGFPEISMDELIDDMAGSLQIGKKQ